MDDELRVGVQAPFDDVVAWVTEALREQGFGVLSTIDVQAMLRAKLDVRIEPFVIFGACNPTLVWQALDIDRRVGVLLPCNVVVRVEAGRVVVEAMEPRTLVDVTGAAQLQQLSAEAHRRLSTALHAVANVAR